MSIVRQDAWTNDEDLILAEVVLRYIREGGTQLQAFEEVGERLSRTAAACGFRWNSAIRKKYESAIAIAKKQRKKLKKDRFSKEDRLETVEFSEEIVEPMNDSITESSSTNITFDDVISFLQEQKESKNQDSRIIRENEELNQEVQTLKQENTQLSKQLSEVLAKYETINEDYKALIGIIDRARKMEVLPNDGDGGKEVRRPTEEVK